MAGELVLRQLQHSYEVIRPQIPTPWRGAQGLAEDVRYYGKWMRAEAEKRIGHLYPKYTLTQEILNSRPDLVMAGYKTGEELTVIAWLWARTVPCPNPALRGKPVPLVSSFWLSKKEGKEAYVEPIVENGDYSFEIRVGKPSNAEVVEAGTKSGRGSNFSCVISGVPISGDYIKDTGKRGEMSSTLMAVVAEGNRGRVYLPADQYQTSVSLKAVPTWAPSGVIPKLTGGSCAPYGMDDLGKLFTSRQLVALTTFSDLVEEARDFAFSHAQTAGQFLDDLRTLEQQGIGPQAYADAVAVYLAFAVSKTTNISSSICSWMTDRGAFRETFARQAIPMTWDFAEANILSDIGGSFSSSLDKGAMAISELPAFGKNEVTQADASKRVIPRDAIISSDPPYYDNISYADLSDFFYVWLRRSLRDVLPLAIPRSTMRSGI